MKVIATKIRGNLNNDRLGYLKAHLVNLDANWEVATKINVPNSGELFIHREYEASIDRAFRYNELIIVETNSLDYQEGDDCVYGASGRDAKAATLNDGIVTVINTELLLKPQDVYRVQSLIKPTNYTFIKMYRETGDGVLVGPFRVTSCQFDLEEQQWTSLLNLVEVENRFFTKLNPYSVYVVNSETIPNGMIFESHTINGASFTVSMGLLAHINQVPTDQLSLISDSSLIKLIDQVVQPNSKLGRKGKRNLAQQVAASNNLSDTLKARMSDLFSDMDQLDEEAKVTLTEALKSVSPEQYTQNPESQDKLKGQVEELTEKLAATRTQLSEAKAAAHLLNEELSAAESKGSDRQIEKIVELKQQLGVYQHSDKLKVSNKELNEKNDKLTTSIDELSIKKEGLNDTVATLQSSLALTTGQFRAKALEVLPFLEIINNVKPIAEKPSIIYPNDAASYLNKSSASELIQEISNRVIKQNYHQSDQGFLNAVVATYLSNRFVGFYGDPGSGKTTLAKLLRNALGKLPLQNSLVRVGKGWSSHADLIGFDNAFSGCFEYKNKFFRQFEKEPEKIGPLKTLILDEASLSSPELYLSDFLAEDDVMSERPFEEIIFSGQELFIPRSLRFIFTFNFDETTEAISERIIDRMPIINNTSVESDQLERITEIEDFQPFEEHQVNDLVMSALGESSVEVDSLLDELENRLTHWNKLPGFKVSTRKKRQIDNFVKLISKVSNEDDQFIFAFIENTFLMPKIRGYGAEYRESLEQLNSNLTSPSVKRQIVNICREGTKFNTFRHL